MAITIKNIIAGEGKISVGASIGSVVDLGATQDGAEISWEPDMVDIEVDQFGDAAKVIQNRAKCMVKTTLAEGTLSNLAKVWGFAEGVGATSPGLQNVSGGTQTFNLGIHSVFPTEYALQIVGNAPGTDATTTKTRTYSCTRVMSYTASSHKLERASNTAFPVEFRILPDPTQTGREYGTIVDQV